MPFQVPTGHERLTSVLEVVYLVFNEGYAATSGDDWLRQGLCDEALRLGRVLAGLAPAEPEVHSLVALMELQGSRLRARVGPTGEPVLLLDQNRANWDHLLIRRGVAALRRAEALGASRGSYQIQAGIAACHARAATPDQTAGKMATGIRVPDKIVEALGSGKRPPVRVTLNGYTYRSTIAVMGGKFLVGVSADVRAAAGVAGGDELDVDIAIDSAPREVAIPPDLQKALKRDAKLRAGFDALSYSKKKSLADPIAQAKTDETRERRLASALKALRGTTV